MVATHNHKLPQSPLVPWLGARAVGQCSSGAGQTAWQLRRPAVSQATSHGSIPLSHRGLLQRMVPPRRVPQVGPIGWPQWHGELDPSRVVLCALQQQQVSTIIKDAPRSAHQARTR